MLDFMVSFAGVLGNWGYVVLFVAVALECQALLGLVMPGEALVLAGGFWASQGGMNPGILILAIALAAICGDSLGYTLGRQLGREWLLTHGKRFGLRLEHFDRVDCLFAKHGGKVVFGSHFLYLLRPLMPFAAGDRRMRYRTFLVYNALGCTLWAILFVSLGYVTGESWQLAAASIGVVGKVAAGGLLLAVALLWLWHRRFALRPEYSADLRQM